MLTPLFDYLRTVTGPRFPTALLVILGGVLALTGDAEKGLLLIGTGVGWYYLELGLVAYKGGETKMNAVGFWLLLGAWCGAWWVVG